VRLDAASVSFHHTAFLDGVTDRFSVVMSNPPYVADTERSRMLPDVVAYEPHGALFAGDDGLDVFRLLLPKAVAALEDGGWLVLEIGHDQRHAISDLAEAEGLTEILVVADLAGRDRVLVARKPPASL
jgi:release factor glutamine methyltransferase